jgi:hypothetical protein
MEELRMLRNSRNREEKERRFPFCRSIYSVLIKIIAYDDAHSRITLPRVAIWICCGMRSAVTGFPTHAMT